MSVISNNSLRLGFRCLIFSELPEGKKKISLHSVVMCIKILGLNPPSSSTCEFDVGMCPTS